MVKIDVLLPKLSKKISEGCHLFWTTVYRDHVLEMLTRTQAIMCGHNPDHYSIPLTEAGSLITNHVSNLQIIQEAQLSQRDHVTLRVIEYFAKSLKVIQNDTCVGRV